MAALPNTTRGGFPNLWGLGEATSYANALLAERGLPPLTTGRAWTWDRMAGFPKPVARLAHGNVYLAEELEPWVRNRMLAMPEVRHCTTRVPDETRAAIIADQGNGSPREIAAKHGVGTATVSRIWARQS